MTAAAPPPLLHWHSSSAEQTEAFAARLAPLLTPPTVVGLSGPLGAGKTCFARGLAAGLGIEPRTVASPSFVYLVDYQGERGAMYHADLYRLGDLDQSAAERAYESIGLYAAFDAAAITVVEWWNYYRGSQPGELVRVEFTIENVDDRLVTLDFAGAGLSAAARLLGEHGRGETDT